MWNWFCYVHQVNDKARETVKKKNVLLYSRRVVYVSCTCNVDQKTSLVQSEFYLNQNPKYNLIYMKLVKYVNILYMLQKIYMF